MFSDCKRSKRPFAARPVLAAARSAPTEASKSAIGRRQRGVELGIKKEGGCAPIERIGIANERAVTTHSIRGVRRKMKQKLKRCWHACQRGITRSACDRGHFSIATALFLATHIRCHFTLRRRSSATLARCSNRSLHPFLHNGNPHHALAPPIKALLFRRQPIAISRSRS